MRPHVLPSSSKIQKKLAPMEDSAANSKPFVALPAARRAPPPLPPSAAASLLIRAPLSTEDNNSASGSEVELDLESTSSSISDDDDERSGSGLESVPDETGPAPGPALDRSGSMPVARLTKDDETETEEEEEEEEEEGFDEVDGDGFVVRVPVAVVEVDEDDENSNAASAEYSEGSEVEGFDDEVDGDGFSTAARVSFQQDGNPSPRPSLVVDDNESRVSEDLKPESSKAVLESSIADADRGEKPELDAAAESEVGGEMSEDDIELDAVSEKDETLGGSFKETNSVVGELENLEPMEVESDTVEIETNKVDKDFNSGEEQFDALVAEEIGDGTGSEIDGVLGEIPNAEKNAEKDGALGEYPVKDQVLTEIFNLPENYEKDGADEYEFSDSVDGTDKESGEHDARDEKDDILESGSAQLNTIDKEEMASAPVEVKSNTIEIEMDEIEDCKHKELESEIDNAAADSNQNHKTGNEDGSVAVESGNSESSASPLDRGNDDEANESVSGISNSAIDSDIADNSADIADSVNETHASLVEDEMTVNKLEQASFDSVAKPYESKPISAGNADLLEDSSKTSGTEEEIEETTAAEDVENIQEKGTKEGEGPNSDEHISMEEGAFNSHDYHHNTREEIVSDEEDGKDLLDSAALLELLRAVASSSTSGNNTVTNSDATRILPDNSPVGLGSSGSSLRPLKPAQSRQPRQTNFTSSNLAVVSKPEKAITEEEKKFHEKVELIRVKFFRLLHRLGLSPDHNVASSVLYHLARAEEMNYWISFQNARKKALELEREGKDKLDFSCDILVIGKAGIGKSATINSIFEEERSLTNPFKPETTSVRKIDGVVDGIKIRVLDTPGLKPSLSDQASNRKILSSVKKYMKNYPPNVVLYMDRFDTQTRDSNDLPLLRSITSTLGSSIWSNAIITLTHAAAAPPDGPSGLPLSYESSVNQRCLVVQQSIRQAAGDMSLMNPVLLVENHPSCRRNGEGQRVLPNGSIWRSEFLLLCCSSKILSEANSLTKVQDSFVQKLFKYRFRSPPMQFFLSSLLESKPHPKLSSELSGINDSDINLDDFSDQEDEEEEYDKLPPFQPLTKSQIAKLTKEHKRAYFDEYDYRVKLLQKKQWKEEIRRVKEIKKRRQNGQAASVYGDTAEDFDDSPTSILTPMPDMVLPSSFDCDNPVYLYRQMEQSSHFSTGFLLDAQGWDHDYGFCGVRLEKLLDIAARFPAAVSVRLRKDKKDFTINLDSSVSARHGESGSSLASLDVQSIGNQLVYIVRGETKFRNLKKNKTTAGVSVTSFGDTVAMGLKLEDQLSIGRRVTLTACTGAVRAEGDVAYGSNLEATLMKEGYPIGQALATLGLSLVRDHSDLLYGGSLQSELSIGRNSTMAIRVGLNNKRKGQIAVRASSSEQLNMSLLGLIPIIIFIFGKIWPGESSSGERHVFQFS